MNIQSHTRGALAAAFVSVSTLLAPAAQAGAIHDASLFTTVLPGNDDGSAGPVNMGFTANFFGLSSNQLYVNNNGNVTFDSALEEFTPFGLAGTSRQIIAPFFADVDTSALDSNVVRYGAATLGGRNVFGVNWIGVGVYDQLPIYNSFQLILIDRSDIGAGDFDFEFNYDMINWNTGQASGGNSAGRGGNPVRVGWSNGSGTTFELTGSGVDGAFLDNGPLALVQNSLNSNVAGRYTFNVRGGQVQPPNNTVPEPTPLVLAGLGLALAGFGARRRAR